MVTVTKKIKPIGTSYGGKHRPPFKLFDNKSKTIIRREKKKLPSERTTAPIVSIAIGALKINKKEIRWTKKKRITMEGKT